jgi:hypothetical protein
VVRKRIFAVAVGLVAVTGFAFVASDPATADEGSQGTDNEAAEFVGYFASETACMEDKALRLAGGGGSALPTTGCYSNLGMWYYAWG